MLLIFNSGSPVFSTPPCGWRLGISNIKCPDLKSHHSLSFSHRDCSLVFSVDGISCLEVRCPSFPLCLPADPLLPICFITRFWSCLLIAHDSYLLWLFSWARCLVLPQVAAEFPLPYLCVTVHTGKACLGHCLGRCVHLLEWSGE